MPSKKVEIQCPTCSGIFKRVPCDINQAIENTGLWRCKTCTLIIKNKALSRPLMSKRRHGPCIKIKTEDGWVFEHRYIMEQHLGRKLDVNEAVHHKNHKRSDNRLENLEIMEHGDHSRFHHLGTKHSMETKRKISKIKKANYVYEKHPFYRHITIKDLKVQYLKHGDTTKASKELGISRTTFYRKLKHFNLTMEELCQA